MLILPVRPAMDAQQQRDPRTFHITDRVGKQAMHFSAIFAPEIDFFGGGDIELRKQRVVVMGDLTKNAAFHGIHFCVFCVASRQNNRVTRRRIPARHDDGWRHQSLDGASGKINLRRIDGAIVGNQKANGFAIGAEARRGDPSVESFNSLHACGSTATVGRDNRQMAHAVGAVLLLVAFKERDPFAVGTPFQTRTAASAGWLGQLLCSGTGLCIGDENLG